jgi:transposase
MSVLNLQPQELAMATAFHFVGIDLHKEVIQVCVLDAVGEVVEERRFRGKSLAEGVKAVEYLERWRARGRFAVEAVGFNRWFVDACRAAQLDVVVVDPVKLNLRMLGKKTDRRDALEIARRLYLGDIDRNAKTYYPTDKEYGARKTIRTRHAFVDMRRKLVNQVRALLAAHRIKIATRVLHSGKGIAELRAQRFDNADLGLCMEQLARVLEAVQGAIDDLTQRIVDTSKAGAIGILVALPNVGPQTAATLVHELGDCSRFKNSKAAASYAGLTPSVANSADKSHHGSLTKRGNRELRFVLGEWAVRLLAFDPVVKRWAASRLRRMHKNKVRMALARRLLVGVYIMLARGEPFSLQRCLASSPSHCAA